MGKLLRTFTYQRNAIRSSVGQSADSAFGVVQRAATQTLSTSPDGSVKDEAFNDCKVFLGTVRRNGDGNPEVTQVGRVFTEMYAESPNDAWRWILTRAMWRNSIPNGTKSTANQHAKDLGVSFNFFDLILRILCHLAAHPSPEDVLNFEELFSILDDDAAWNQTPHDLYRRLITWRGEDAVTMAGHRTLLGDLEDQYGIARDNMSTVFNKAFKQSGLFEMVEHDRLLIGLRIGTEASRQPILARRLRFVLDNPSNWNESE